MASFPNQLGPGSFVPTTNIWDVSEIYSTSVTSDEFKELLVRLYQNLNIMSLNLNIKTTGYYPLTEFVTGEAFFPNPDTTLTTSSGINRGLRQVFIKVINFGALPNTGTKKIAHGISIRTKTVSPGPPPLTTESGYTFIDIYGTASDTTGANYIHLPYASTTALNQNVSLDVDATDVIVTTGTNRSNYDTTYIILKYIKE